MHLIYTSDTHSYLFPTLYSERGERNMGLMRIAGTIHKDRDTVVIDGGDSLQGSALSKYVLDRNIRPFPQAQVFRAMGTDIMVPGNHDFNYGYEAFHSFFAGTGAAILAANLIDRTGRTTILPSIIREDSNGIRVAFVGLVTDYIRVWEKKENLECFEITDSFSAARRELEAVRNKADYTVLVYHGGFECDIETGERLSDTNENIAYRIAAELDYDLILSAHQHMNIPLTKVGNSYAVQCRANAEFFAEIDIDKDGITGCIRQPEDRISRLEKEYSSLGRDIEAWLDESIARIEHPITAPTHLESALRGSRIADFFNTVQLEASHADISCTSLANDLYGFSGNVTIREVIASYQYPNALAVIEVGKEELKAALEHAAEYFALENGKPAISSAFLLPKVAHYNYDYYMGIEYAFDLSKPVGERVSRLLFKGREIEGKLRLCMNSYRATGAGGYSVFRSCPVIESLDLDVQDLAIDYLIRHRDGLSWPEADFSTAGY